MPALHLLDVPLARLRRRALASPRWVGGYVDFLQIRGEESGMLSIGPELGVSMLGVDIGYVQGYGTFEGNGIRARGILTIYGVVSLAAGGGRFDGEGFGQVGILLKAPIPIRSKFLF